MPGCEGGMDLDASSLIVVAVVVVVVVDRLTTCILRSTVLVPSQHRLLGRSTKMTSSFQGSSTQCATACGSACKPLQISLGSGLGEKAKDYAHIVGVHANQQPPAPGCI